MFLFVCFHLQLAWLSSWLGRVQHHHYRHCRHHRHHHYRRRHHLYPVPGLLQFAVRQSQTYRAHWRVLTKATRSAAPSWEPLPTPASWRHLSACEQI